MRRMLMLLLLLVGCVTTNTTPQKSTWKVLKKTDSSAHSNFVPSGTELIFTSSKNFTAKDNQVVIELPPTKRCILASSLSKQKENTLSPNTVLTVVGYRGETSELVLSETSYQQYFLSCSSKTIDQKRKTSSIVRAQTWQKSVIELDDLKKMSPLFQLKFVPQ